MKKITLLVICCLFSAFAFAQPPNDTCAGATPITPSAEGTGCGVATFTLPFTTDGTTDSGVPTVCSTPGLDQYFTWTATAPGLVFNSANPGSPGIAVFASCADVAAGTDISCASTFASGAQLSGWSVGDNLIIQVYDFNGSFSDIAFCLEEFTPPPPPPNDDCSGAITVMNGSVNTGDTTAATVDGQSFCGTSNSAPGTWYVFNDGGVGAFNVNASLCVGSTFDTKISVYSGTCAAPVCVGGSDDSCGAQSQLDFTTDGLGTDYFILVHGFSASTGAYTLTTTAVLAPSPPANDDCSGAISVMDGSVETGDTADATVDGQSFCGTSNTAPGTWYVFNDGGLDVFNVNASLCVGSGYDTKISVYSGTCAAPVCVGGSDDSCGAQSQLDFTTDGLGTDYFILVHGFSSSTGAYTLTVTADAVVNPITLCDPLADTGAPVVTCPADVGASGGGATCSDPVVVDYDFPTITDDCGARLSQNTDETVNDAFDCSGQITGHVREFDLAAMGIVNSFVLSEVEVGVWSATNSPVMTINVYDQADIPGGIGAFTPPMSATLTPLASVDFTVPNGAQTSVIVPISAILDPGTTMVIEVLSPNNANFLIGYNNSGTGTANATSPSFLGCQGAGIAYETPGNLGAAFSGFSAVIVPTGADLTIVQSAGLASGDTFPAGDTLNTFDVTDAAGNTTSCSFTVTIGDFTAPDVTGPIDIFTGTGGAGGLCSAIVNYDPIVATDNCSADTDITVTLTEGLASGSAFPVGTTVVTYSVLDTAGNETLFTFNVTITDTSAPAIDCPADFAVSPDASGNYTLPDWTTLASDACSSGADLVTTQDPIAGTVVADGSVTAVTITSTDAAGNVSVCTFNLTVDATLSVNDLALDNAVSIYPNPTANVFTLTNGSGASLETMTIVDVNGRIIDTISLTEMDTEKEISIANYATGIYFARISSENATTVKRIVKQ
ncbi:MAG: hypothetical protein ACI828_001546 [Flavobacteriales bacterium]|jgi:hypothetical protein